MRSVLRKWLIILTILSITLGFVIGKAIPDELKENQLKLEIIKAKEYRLRVEINRINLENRLVQIEKEIIQKEIKRLEEEKKNGELRKESNEDQKKDSGCEKGSCNDR